MIDSIFTPTPITQKPEKDGWYYVMNKGCEILPRMTEYKTGNWQDYSGLTLAFWLRPAKLSEVIGEAWDNCETFASWVTSAELQRKKQEYINSKINQP